MFCGKCGKELPEQALFCDRCGEKLVLPKKVNTAQPLNSQQVSNQPPQPNGQAYQAASQQNGFAPQQSYQPYKTAHKKAIPFVTKVLIIEAIAFVIFAGIFYMKLKEYTSAETIAKTYFTSVMAGDQKKAYDMIEVEESDFVNEKYFGKLLEQIGCKNVYNYRVKNVETETGNYTKEIQIVYRLKEDTEDYIFYVELDKAASKKFFLFDDWKVNVGDYIQKDVLLYVAGDSKVDIEGVSLEQNALSNLQDGNGTVQYTIPKMFYGTYEAVITSDIYTDCNMTFTVDGYNSIFYEDEEGTITIKPEILSKIMEQSQADFKTLWKGAVQQTDFEKLSSIQLAEDTDDVEEDYEDLAEAFQNDDGIGLKKMDFENFEVTAKASDGGLTFVAPYIYVEFTAPFTCTSTSRDWWSGKLQDKDSSGNYSGSMYYTYQNGSWVLTETSISNFYY